MTSLESKDFRDGPWAQGACLWIAGPPLCWALPWAGNECSVSSTKPREPLAQPATVVGPQALG